MAAALADDPDPERDRRLARIEAMGQRLRDGLDADRPRATASACARPARCRCPWSCSTTTRICAQGNCLLRRGAARRRLPAPAAQHVPLRRASAGRHRPGARGRRRSHGGHRRDRAPARLIRSPLSQRPSAGSLDVLHRPHLRRAIVAGCRSWKAATILREGHRLCREAQYVPLHEARIPLLDQGFLKSDLTYDVPAVWDGRFFRLDDHLDRFERSCERLRLRSPLPRQEMRDRLVEMTAMSGIRDAYVMLIVTRGLRYIRQYAPEECENSATSWSCPISGSWTRRPRRPAAVLSSRAPFAACRPAPSTRP